MRALITGVMGQDGWYLSELLLSKGYDVFGMRRGNDDPRAAPPGVRVVYGDVSDATCMRDLAEKHRPHEIYNLAALTHVGDSFSSVAACFAANAVGAENCLDAGRRVDAKVYQASTSELFGDAPAPQSESTAMRPRSPYGCAKLAAYWLTRNHRERGMYACQGILFNHESPKRGGGFVTQKVCRAAADISRGRAKYVALGNLDSSRDWGHARDYVRAMWMVMQQPVPDDYVVATGEMRSIRDLCAAAFGAVDLNWQEHVRISPDFKRPLDVTELRGDASKILAIGWRPEVTFDQMIAEMVEAAL